MTGLEHYEEAESDIELAMLEGPSAREDEQAFLQRAQVHAILALAAAASSNGGLDEPYGGVS